MSINWTNVTSPQDLLGIPNANTGGYFWIAMLFLIWFVLFSVLSTWGTEIALLSSAFVCLVAGILLVYMDLMAWQWCLFFIGFLVMLFLYITWSSGKDR